MICRSTTRSQLRRAGEDAVPRTSWRARTTTGRGRSTPRHAQLHEPEAWQVHLPRQGLNNSGVWNEAGASLEFSVAPAYYQTSWFRAASVAILALLLWTGYRVRVGVIERHAAQISALNERLMKAQEQERTRIAGELHDSVMQQIIRAQPGPGHGETADRRRLGSEGDGRRRAAQADRRRDRGP